MTNSIEISNLSYQYGKQLATHRLKILKKVGSLIEYPSIYGHLTANENLLVWQKICC